MQPTPSRLVPCVFAAAFPLALAAGFLPTEFTHYKRWLGIGTDETALRVAILFFIGSKSLLAVVASLFLLAPSSRVLSPWALRSLSMGLSLLIFGFLALDLELQGNTGNNIAHYLPFVFDPDFSVWAGRGFDVAPSLFRVGSKMLLLFAAAFAFAWSLERWALRSSAPRARRALFGLAFFSLAPLLVTAILARTGATPGVLYHLGERMPWTWQVGFDDRSLVFGEIQERAQEVYDRIQPGPFRPRSLFGLLGDTRPAVRPDILLIAVESLRYDVLDPETMPHVWQMSERGVRLNEHYATSNASHYGMFSLLYGRSPLFYFETLDAEEPPTLPFQLKEWGYTTHYLSCADTHWGEMDRFLGTPHFSVERSRGKTLEECDRKVTSRAAELFEPGLREPRFVIAFMMSTHFGYHYPEGAGPFAPALPPPNALALDAERDRDALFNRYRNSAHYVDALIGSLLDRLDRGNTLIVVTGDHGESLFDDGTISHSSLLSEIQTRVPLAMSGPGVDRANTRRGPTDHRDVMPTIFGQLGLTADSLRKFPGRDLLAADERAFAPLVHAKARRGGIDAIALVSSAQRYSFRLDVDRGRLRFLGKLGENGRSLREPVSLEEGDMAIRWLEQYMNSLAGN